MKDSPSGIKSGVVAGVLYPTVQYGVSFLASDGKLTLTYMATLDLQLPVVKLLGLTVEMVVLILLFGFVLFSVIFAGVGAILGIVAVRFVNKFHIRSISLGALAIGVIVYAVVSLLRFLTTRTIMDIWTLVGIVVDSLIFSLLYMRRTKSFSRFIQNI